jgi:hypothetical protein
MNARRQPRILVRILAVTSLALTPLGCEDADTITGVRPSPTPTPGPVVIAGTWTGSITASYMGNGGPTTCQNPSLTGTFEQQGRDVTATFRPHRCGAPFRVSGRIDGSLLIGSAYGWDPGQDNPYRDAPVEGHLRPDGTLSISVVSTSPRYEAEMVLDR